MCIRDRLQGVKIVALDEKIPGGVEVNRRFAGRPERFRDGRVRDEQCLALAWPIELIALLRTFNDVI